jgi:hypothetical protein
MDARKKLTAGWCIIDTAANDEVIRGPFLHQETAKFVLDEMERWATGPELLRLGLLTVAWSGGRKRPKRPPFKRPALAEVKEYCAARRNGIDPEQFWSYYEARGWMIGKTRMKNWKAAVITWERRDANGEKAVDPKKEHEDFIRGRTGK